jgi:hypothetical protein
MGANIARKTVNKYKFFEANPAILPNLLSQTAIFLVRKRASDGCFFRPKKYPVCFKRIFPAVWANG